MLAALACVLCAHAGQDDIPQADLGKGLEYKVEAQGSFSSGKTPLWLNANKYGLSSLDKVNGYLRASVIRPLQKDSDRKWGIGYGLDLAVPYHYTSKLVVQQAFGEVRWLHGVLSVGSNEYPMELKNNQLSSGSQTLGINARPVPQVRLALRDYWTLPFANGWLHLKGHVSYGEMTDGDWQKDFTNERPGTKHVEHVLLHTKAGYLKIGNEDIFCPWSLELGLEMATLFGGTSYQPQADGTINTVKRGTSLKDFLKAFVPTGSDNPAEGSEGDVLGSWVIRASYDADTWKFSLYGDHFFEDGSAMLMVKPDGNGGMFLYDMKDMLVGAELNLKYNRWIRDVVFEYIYTKYQSGPIYHGSTGLIPTKVNGEDNYYNHYIYPGWQHWGQVMGNPLYRSPIYNDDGAVDIKDSRFVALHLGIDGQPTDNLGYRILATYQTGYGTYASPYVKTKHNISLMLEATYRFKHNWMVKGTYGMDFGKLLGDNTGFQLTISKGGIFNL